MSEAAYEKRLHRRNTGRDAAYEQLGEAEDGYPAPKGSDLEHATLLDWCREFCESALPLKEFKLQKVVYGWEPNPLLVGEWFLIDKGCCPYVSLLIAIRAAIASTDYQGTVQVNFSQQRSLVTVYPDNQLSRWLAKVRPMSNRFGPCLTAIIAGMGSLPVMDHITLSFRLVLVSVE